ncbi:MAG TPA: HlyD family efflux transporter periplasmic adaptor subunit [Thermoanaerobaculia bacterium]|nr:HlyD family efflux transporter periplasmic adaptor subunit [Thermoanaerobaculia bacterium]
MRIRVLASLVPLFVGACFSGYSEDGPKSDVRTRRGTFVNALVLTGELDAARGATIAVPELPQWQSSIKWLAPDGSQVKKGERVVELDNSSFTNDLDTKRHVALETEQQMAQKEAEWKADLEQKQLDDDSRKSDYEKTKIDATVPRDILSAREYQDRQTRFDRASVEFAKARDIFASQKKENGADRRNLELQLGKARRDIAIAERAIQSAVLRAPRDGVVIIKDIPWEGRKLQTGDTVWVGFALAVIPEMESLRVNAQLADVDDGRVRVGMPATVVLDGYPGKTFSGRVTSISAVAQETNPKSLRRMFKVFVDLDRIDAQLMRPGLSARVIVRTQVISNAQLVSRSETLPKNLKLGPCNAQECVVEQ